MMPPYHLTLRVSELKGLRVPWREWFVLLLLSPPLCSSLLSHLSKAPVRERV